MQTRTRITRHLETIMHGRSTGAASMTGRLLRAVSHLYGAAVDCRGRLYRRGVIRVQKIPCTVISIGNLTLGGTGKTPMTMYMARWLHREGYRVVVISRGYRGRASKQGGVVGDGRRIFMGPGDAGDEPYMMAGRLAGIPVVVGRDRFAAGMLAVRRFRPQIVLLDDGFQHLRLFRDLDLVLLDSRQPFGNRRLVPAGNLREPVTALDRADACILTRSDPNRGDRCPSIPGKKPVFASVHRPTLYTPEPPGPAAASGNRAGALCAMDGESLADRSVVAFSGIANSLDFRRTVARLCVRISGFYAFPDHHAYSDEDLAAVCRAAQARGADTLVTTEKDWVKIGHRLPRTTDLAVIGIETDFRADTGAFHDFIRRRLPD